MLFTYHEEESHKHLRSYLIFCLQNFREVLNALPCHKMTEPERSSTGLSRPLLVFMSVFAFLLCSLLPWDPLVQQWSRPMSWSLCVQEVCFLVELLCSI